MVSRKRIYACEYPYGVFSMLSRINRLMHPMKELVALCFCSLLFLNPLMCKVAFSLICKDDEYIFFCPFSLQQLNARQNHI